MRLIDADLDRFVARVRARLEVGATIYGDSTFLRPTAELVDELMQEVQDIAGWGLLLWIRLDELRGRIESVRKKGEQ